MGQRKGFLLSWIGISALVILVFGGVYLFIAIDSITAEERARADGLSWRLADQAAFDLAQGTKEGLDLLTSLLVLENVVYAQVINNGLIVSERRLFESPLPVAQTPYGIWEIFTIQIEGKSYWDVRRVIPGTNAFVRLGLSLSPLESKIRMQVLTVGGIGVGFLMIIIMIASFLSRRLESAKSHIESQTTFSHEPAFVELNYADDVKNPNPELAESVVGKGAPANSHHLIRVGDLLIDDGSKRVELRGNYVELSPKEFDLVLLLAKEPGRVFSNQEIIANVWADSHMATAQDVKQYIYFVRQKLETDPKNPSLLITVRGFGYKLQI